MNNPLSFHFFEISGDLLLGKDVLTKRGWRVEPANFAYLVGNAPESSHTLAELPGLEVLGRDSKDRSQEDVRVVIGDISHSLTAGDQIILARGSQLQEAEILAAKMGYRPVRAGEFLQLIDILPKVYLGEWTGWLYCYAGRVAGYAILTSYSSYRVPAVISEIVFDTYIGKSGILTSSMENFLLFVKPSSISD